MTEIIVKIEATTKGMSCKVEGGQRTVPENPRVAEAERAVAQNLVMLLEEAYKEMMTRVMKQDGGEMMTVDDTQSPMGSALVNKFQKRLNS